MGNKLIIASAGSGKTTYIINQALKISDKRVLITTFTEANEQEIRKKFIELNGIIPSNIVVQTWFSFLIEHGVKPYQSCLFDGDVTGLQLVNAQSALKFKGKYGPVYHKETDVRNHYFNRNGQIFSDKLSKFVIKVNSASNGYVISRLAKIYPCVFIDEVQDMAGYDLEFIKLLFESNIQVTMVGDPRQVTYLTHYDKKHKKYLDGKIEDFISNDCKKLDVCIDKTSLNKTFRNRKEICLFANTIFNEYEGCQWVEKDSTQHDGMFFVKKSDIDNYLEHYKPIQLRDKVSVKTNERYIAMNFGVSKGLTFERTLIYPTKKMLDWIQDNNVELPFPTRAKFYVAVTRALHSVGIVVDDNFEKEIDGIQYYTP